MKNYSLEKYDLAVIGSGGAGLMAAISAAEAGLEKVAVISKVKPLNSHTGAATGGINAALGNVTKDDWRWHLHDTLKGGDGLSDVDACEILCKNAKAAIEDLEAFGVDFSRDKNGNIAQRKYGGQKLNNGRGDFAYRACYSKDQTGKTILNSLYEKALSLEIVFFDEYFVLDLLMSENSCYGCLALEISSGELLVFEAQNTLIATGGYSQIYRTTTSAAICTGDGTALALKSGLPLQDMEFIQFHPSGIAGQGFLITEAARAEGGYLINSDGERFMKNYDSEMMELSSRDVVARAIATEITQGRGVGEDKSGIYLDLTHLDDEIFVNKIPAVVQFSKDLANIDVRKSPIVIAPSAHYNMGGIPTDLECRVVANNEIVTGLMAVGEAACLSVHGANRLGCNSLLDLIVFGKIAGQKAADMGPLTENVELAGVVDKKIQEFCHLVGFSGGLASESLLEVKASLQNINERHLGVFRSDKLMQEGFCKLEKVKASLDRYGVKNKSLSYNLELIDLLELKNLYLNSYASFKAALTRKESRGAHYNVDYPAKDDENWLRHSLVEL